MPVPGSPAAAGLDIAVVSRNGKTMTQHGMDVKGRLRFRNLSDATLTITCASGQEPFVVEGCADPVGNFTVPGGGARVVRIAESFKKGDSFVYSAQIDGTEAEDPVIIFDKP
jgi:hypothetical protein